MSELTIWHDPAPERVGASALELLRRMGAPGAILVRGEDPTRTRAIVTLLHGNEPSGVRAMHAWLLRRQTPRVNCLWIVGAVDAALEPPGFAHRHLPGRPDLNRCFRPPFRSPEAQTAERILGLLEQHHPEAVLDLHNNTGPNPAYGIAVRGDSSHTGLCAFFATRLVRSDLHLGALVEVLQHGAPSVTIECGRAGDPEADRLALRGVGAFLSSDTLAPTPRPAVEVFEEPTRVSIREGKTLAIAQSPQPEADLTLASAFDSHNWKTIDAGTPIGWTCAERQWPIEARGAAGGDVSRDLFRLQGRVVCTRKPLIPIMITADTQIAASDCLFYVVRRSE